MSFDFTADLLSQFATKIGGDANYQSPGNFGLTSSLTGSVGISSVTVNTAGSYTTAPTASPASGTATFQVKLGVVTVSAVAAAGTVYTPADVLTLVGGTSTTSAQLTVATVKLVSATIAAGGTGYGNAQTFNVTVAGGTSTSASVISVTSSAGGVVTTVNSIGTPGSYTVLPSLTANAVTGGSGTGLTLNLVYGILTTTISRAGSYSVLPANPVSVTGGTGTGATFTLAWGVVALNVTSPGSYEVVPAITFSAGAAAATAVLSSATTAQGDARKLLIMIDIFKALIGETNSAVQLKDIHQVLSKMMAEMKFGASANYSASTTATNAQSAALQYIAKNLTHLHAAI